MKKKSMLIVLVIMLVIGFAAVSTTLIINGVVGIGTNSNDYDVVFIEAMVDEELSKATISGNGKKITFALNKLTEVGTSSVLDYKVKNNSTQYGAKVTISCTVEENEYIKLTSEFGGNSLPITEGIEMEAQEVKSGRITAELTKSYTEEDKSFNIDCEIVARGTEKETTVEYEPPMFAKNIFYDNTKTKIDCDNVQCAITKLNELVERVK